ncbi:Protein-export membrane protein SecG [secondary endosymbiont of Trabutina mannipara]|uniref:Protein-export membrane protein SecG n=1 Tax=secondary endosymbiont of Trabutina mannipara TaxID=1835721 RepID=A0A1C3L4B9_9ENTR|nr:preprotein translocase subunit SecG [secondary endosymbiont of Trabutina mannipara]SBT82059.1 Protein-export membrane protein SecG [secondary endosymbiont of Trabutina mannipara]
MYRFLLIIFIVISIVLITLIMLQKIKGANNVSTSSSIGSSSTILGFKKSSNFVTRITFMLAALFFIISLILGKLNNKYILKKNGNKRSKKVTN